MGDPALDLGMKANVDRPQSVGADRLCNTVAAHERYKGAVIVVDFGTATNFDIVAENGDFDGSVIAPGANLSIEALHQAAALLPRVAIHRAQKVIGRDTVAGMQSGVYWGYVGLIDGLIDAHQDRIWQAHDGGGDRRAGASVPARHSRHRAYRSRSHHARPDADPRPQRKAWPDAANSDELVFLPLGGSGEIGMNFNAYGFGPAHRRQWIMVDCGVLFGRETDTPGVDLIMPDIRFLAERREDVLGIVATHAHEDHIGAIAPLWPIAANARSMPRLSPPRLIEGKLEEAGLCGAASRKCRWAAR